METAAKIWTDDELVALPRDGHKRELFNGRIIMSPAGWNHGKISLRIAGKLESFVRRKKLGVVFDSSTGFRLSPDNCLSPDAAFYSTERLARMRPLPAVFLREAPDLVVEVLSPRDSLKQMGAKMEKYFERGCRMAWVSDPKNKTAIVYRSAVPDRLLAVEESLDGAEVLPGFRASLAAIFADITGLD
jgi:Uma2 family endonuclease